MTDWFFNTPGIGSIIVFVVGISVFIAYVRMFRWIQTTPPDLESANEPPTSDMEK